MLTFDPFHGSINMETVEYIILRLEGYSCIFVIMEIT